MAWQRDLDHGGGRDVPAVHPQTPAVRRAGADGAGWPRELRASSRVERQLSPHAAGHAGHATGSHAARSHAAFARDLGCTLALHAARSLAARGHAAFARDLGSALALHAARPLAASLSLVTLGRRFLLLAFVALGRRFLLLTLGTLGRSFLLLALVANLLTCRARLVAKARRGLGVPI